MNAAPCPTKAALVPRRPRGPFPTRDLRTLQELGPEAFWMVLDADRRNLTPDQLALVMGRHGNRTKKDPSERMRGNDFRKRRAQSERKESDATDLKLAKEYGVGRATVRRNMKFAAAVETLKAVDPDIEQKVVTTEEAS